MYSSDQFFADWRYRIDKDFVKPSGCPFEYASHGLRNWGDELLDIPYSAGADPSENKCAAVSDDGKYVAVSSGNDIYVLDLLEVKPSRVLRGHVTVVDAIAFRPGSPTQLVSVAMNDNINSRPADPEIIFWDLVTHIDNAYATPEAIERFARNTANSIMADFKAKPSPIKVSASNQLAFAKELEGPIRKFVVSAGVVDNTRLFGRLLKNFQSQIFSPSGYLMFYMPGEAPEYNGDDDWELRLFSPDTKSDAVVLSGHRDSITWAGFNSDETLVGTASWDQTFRVWDAKTGKTKFLFLTETQNWTAQFSPDGKYLAGTSGDYKLHIYNLSTGTEDLTIQTQTEWNRTLSWHPFKPLLALGGDDLGRVSLIDVINNETIQCRALSTRATKYPDDVKDFDPGKGMLSVTHVHFVDGGRKIAFFTEGDGSIEVYDLEQYTKWRFARSGTMNPPDDKSEVTSKAGYDMCVLENRNTRKIMLLSIDGDGVRLWSVPMTS